jgi:hypothetical protein
MGGVSSLRRWEWLMKAGVFWGMVVGGVVCGGV